MEGLATLSKSERKIKCCAVGNNGIWEEGGNGGGWIIEFIGYGRGEWMLVAVAAGLSFKANSTTTRAVFLLSV
jgi:hypothetical protein